MTDAALKLEDRFVRVRRVTRPELQDMAPFICRRLKQHYPTKQERELYGWLTTCCDSNEYFFARSDHAVVLAQSSRPFLSDRPSVTEIFVLAQLQDGKVPKGSDAERAQAEHNALALFEAASLYGDLIRWCQKIGADELMVDKCSDVPLGDKGKEKEPGTLRWIFANQSIQLLKGEEIFAQFDPTAKLRRGGAA